MRRGAARWWPNRQCRGGFTIRKALPAAGRCHAGQSLGPEDYRPATLNAVDCAAEHQAEIVRVGQLTTPPENKTREVYTDCDTAAREYVGGDWHEGRLGLAVIVPSTKSGSRASTSIDAPCSVLRRRLHLPAADRQPEDGLRGTRPLVLTCVDVLAIPDGQGWYQSIDRLVPIDCAQPHNGEYVGLYISPDVPYPGITKLAREVTQACNAKAATFLGQSQSKFDRRTDLIVIPTGGNPERWAFGDHTARCYIVTSPDNRVTQSLKANP